MIDKNTNFLPGKVWLDTDGKPIQAHAGGFMFHEGIYYWYGEDKDGETLSGEHIGCGYRVDVIGIRCYSSTDLYNWRNEGLVLPAVPYDQEHDLHTSRVVERPKVIYNKKSNKFVMWVHIDDKDYNSGKVGVATSDYPVGPFIYLRSFYPNANDSRDMTVYKDDNDKAFLIHSSEWNKTLYISELTEDYLDVTGKYTRNFVDCYREAPAIFKHKSTYYLISSGCSGWDPNEAQFAVAEAIIGPWVQKGNPCIGPDADKTFYAQSTYVIPICNGESTFIMAFDRHKKENLRESSYVWLPIKVDGQALTIEWHDAWEI